MLRIQLTQLGIGGFKHKRKQVLVATVSIAVVYRHVLNQQGNPWKIKLGTNTKVMNTLVTSQQYHQLFFQRLNITLGREKQIALFGMKLKATTQSEKIAHREKTLSQHVIRTNTETLLGK